MPVNTVPGVKGFVGLPWLDRFWGRVDMSNGPDACWPWLGGKSRGYGSMSVDGRNRRATHLSLEAHGLCLPGEGEMVCHHCDNPPCVNPKHLFIGTMRDNIRDAREKGRVRTPHELGVKPWQLRLDHCKHGHPLTPSKCRPGRTCETCRRARDVARLARLAAGRREAALHAALAEEEPK